MDASHKVEISYSHPVSATPRETEILARVTLLDAKKAVAVLEKDDAALATIQAELDALCVEWDAGRKPSTPGV